MVENGKKQKPKYKVKVQAAGVQKCGVFALWSFRKWSFHDRMSPGYVYESGLCRFFARVMNRRQIVSRCGGVQKCVYESWIFSEVIFSRSDEHEQVWWWYYYFQPSITWHGVIDVSQILNRCQNASSIQVLDVYWKVFWMSYNDL